MVDGLRDKERKSLRDIEKVQMLWIKSCECVRLGVQQLTYTFLMKTGNANEIKYVFNDTPKTLSNQTTQRYCDNNIRFITIGRINTLPSQVLRDSRLHAMQVKIILV